MLKSITFEVVGDQRLVCEGCEVLVEGLLKGLQGVSKVRAQARKQRIEVLFDASGLEATAIAERLGQAGYETRVGSSTSDSALIDGTKGKPAKGHRETLSRGRSWARSLLLLPGALLPLLPSATCPVCLGAYAGVISAIGLGFVINERVLVPLIALFLGINIVSVAWSTRSHRRREPLLGTLLGSAAVVVGRLIWHVHLLVYSGVALLLVASLFNLWLKRPPQERLIQIVRARNE